MAPPGKMPANPFSVIMVFIWTEKFAIKKETLCHLTADLGTVDNDSGRWIFVPEVGRHVLVNFGPWWPHWNFAKFQKHKINPRNGYSTVTFVCKIPFRWLKCSSLNPCLNLQSVKKNSSLGFNCLGLPCLGASSSHFRLLTVAESSECQ